jgi:hypothetical protein
LIRINLSGFNMKESGIIPSRYTLTDNASSFVDIRKQVNAYKVIPNAEVYPAVDSYLNYHRANVNQIFEEVQRINLYRDLSHVEELKRLWEIRKTSNGSEFL